MQAGFRCLFLPDNKGSLKSITFFYHLSIPMAAEESKCPVDHSTYEKFLPPRQQQQQQDEAKNKEEAKCPVDHTSYKHFLPQSKEGCDSDAINARNNMPAVAQQSPHPGQAIPLSTEREVSTIPRADGTDQKWIYPSEQMFFNAMRRKNWDPKERDMSVVVPIHNAVNEQAWAKILEWEKMHQTYVTSLAPYLDRRY